MFIDEVKTLVDGALAKNVPLNVRDELFESFTDD